MITILAALGVLAAPSGLASSAARPGSDGAACQAATDYVTDVLARSRKRPVIFSTAIHPYFRLRSIAIHWTGPGPPAAGAERALRQLVRRWSRPRNLDAIAHCPRLRRFLESGHVAFSSEAVETAVRGQSNGLFAATIESLTLPMVSDDGDFAMLIAGSQAGGEAGGGRLVMLERQLGGAWKVIGDSGLWIS